jgi:NTP pyrophosphatase (non-canonical NTP hydrolase)
VPAQARPGPPLGPPIYKGGESSLVVRGRPSAGGAARAVAKPPHFTSRRTPPNGSCSINETISRRDTFGAAEGRTASKVPEADCIAVAAMTVENNTAAFRSAMLYVGEDRLPMARHRSGLKNFCGKPATRIACGMNSQVFNKAIHSFSNGKLSGGLLRGVRLTYNPGARQALAMPKKRQHSSAQILLFPSGQPIELGDPNASRCREGPSLICRSAAPHQDQAPGCEVVLSGSYRRDVEGLRRVYEELRALGCTVLSPSRVDPSHEANGFVFMVGEETSTPEQIESRHLEAIQRAAFVWLYAPQGYVGPSAALEVGFARAQGIPVFCTVQVSDATLRSFVTTVGSIPEGVNLAKENKFAVPTPSVAAFQHYYRRVASQRGYERENARDCLLLMVEEVGELARAIRKRENLVRHGLTGQTNEADELADVFLYVIHMANIFGLDISTAVRGKERINIEKFVGSR